MGAPPSGLGDLVWFIDRCLGRHVVADALRAVGAHVEVQDDYFAQDADDEEWLLEIGQRGWLLITRDEKIQRRPAERKALEAAGVGAFFVSGGGMTGPEIGALLAGVLPKLARKVAQLTRPFIVTISPSGELRVKLGERRAGVKRR